MILVVALFLGNTYTVILILLFTLDRERFEMDEQACWPKLVCKLQRNKGWTSQKSFPYKTILVLYMCFEVAHQIDYIKVVLSFRQNDNLQSLHLWWRRNSSLLSRVAEKQTYFYVQGKDFNTLICPRWQPKHTNMSKVRNWTQSYVFGKKLNILLCPR